MMAYLSLIKKALESVISGVVTVGLDGVALDGDALKVSGGSGGLSVLARDKGRILVGADNSSSTGLNETTQPPAGTKEIVLAVSLTNGASASDLREVGAEILQYTSDGNDQHGTVYVQSVRSALARVPRLDTGAVICRLYNRGADSEQLNWSLIYLG